MEYLYTYSWKLKLIGLWPFFSTKKEFYIKTFWSFLLDGICIIDLLSQIPMIIKIDDLILRVEALLYFNSTFETIVKAWTFLFGLKKIQLIIIALSELYKNTPIVINENIRRDTETNKKRSDFLANACGYIALTIYCLFALSAIIKYIQYNKKEYLRLAYFPGRENSLVYYFIACGIQTIASFRVTVLYVADMFFLHWCY